MRVRPNCPQTGEKRLWNQWLGLPFVAGWAERDRLNYQPECRIAALKCGLAPMTFSMRNGAS